MTRRYVMLAVGVGGMTVLFAVALVLLWFVSFGVPEPKQEFISLAFWTPLLGVFMTLYALTFQDRLAQGPRFAEAMGLGAAGAVGWLVVVSLPSGLWIAWLDLPLPLIWPLAGALGVATVAPRPGRGFGDERGWDGFWLSGLAVFALGLKAVPPAWVGPDFRHYTLGSIPAPPPSSTRSSASRGVDRPIPELGNAAAPLTPRCHAPAPRPLALDPVVRDLSSIARPLGTFTDRSEREVGGVPHVYGRTLTLWSVESSLTGTLESRSGPAADPGSRAVLEVAQLDDVTDAFTFDAYFEDGFLSRFRGILTEDSVDGVLETMDSQCTTRILTTDTVVLKRDDGPPSPGGTPTFRTLMSRLVASGAFRRERR